MTGILVAGLILQGIMNFILLAILRTHREQMGVLNARVDLVRERIDYSTRAAPSRRKGGVA